MYDPDAPTITTYGLRHRLQLLGSGDGEFSRVGKLEKEREAGETFGKQLTGLLDTGGNAGSYRPIVFFGSPDGFWRGSINHRTLGAACEVQRRK